MVTGDDGPGLKYKFMMLWTQGYEEGQGSVSEEVSLGLQQFG